MTATPTELQMLLDAVWNSGQTPILLVELPVPGLPPFVAARFEAKGHIAFALKAQDPLNLVYTADGLEADFAFTGTVARCTVKWAMVLAIFSEGEGYYTRERGVFLVPGGPVDALGRPANVPEEKPTFKFKVIKGGKA